MATGGATGVAASAAAPSKRQLNQDRIRFIRNRLDDCVFAPDFPERVAYRFRRRTLFEARRNDRATFEINAEVKCFGAVRMFPLAIDSGAQPSDH